MASPVSEIKRPHDVPDKIGKYVIINKIGKGSTGVVYLSHDPYYRRDVAIKVYNIEEDVDADRAQVSRKMFFNEAHMVGMLQHPNIMPIYDAGEEAEQLLKDAFNLYFMENGLDPTSFPSCMELEKEVIGMAVDLVNGGADATGTFTSGGTESILLSLKTTRDYYREVKPEITEPEPELARV